MGSWSTGNLAGTGSATAVSGSGWSVHRLARWLRRITTDRTALGEGVWCQPSKQQGGWCLLFWVLYVTARQVI